MVCVVTGASSDSIFWGGNVYRMRGNQGVESLRKPNVTQYLNFRKLALVGSSKRWRQMSKNARTARCIKPIFDLRQILRDHKCKLSKSWKGSKQWGLCFIFIGRATILRTIGHEDDWLKIRSVM